MISNSFLLAYLIAFVCFFLWELFLNSLQLQALKSDIVYQQDIKENFNAEVLEKAEAYSKSKAKLGLFAHCYSNLILLLVIFSGGLVTLHDFLSSCLPNSYFLFGLVYILAVTFIFQLFDLPLSLYSTFIIEQRAGFNKLTLKQWGQDLLKNTILSLVLMSPLLIGVLWFVQAFPENWWIFAFILIVSFQTLLLFLYPVWIAPLFNKFEKFPEGELRDGIFKLSKQLNFDLNEVYLMDGSKRSGHGNAYFTGFGKNQRVVLYDTLVSELSVDEILAVLAHEIGHKKLKHVLKQLGMMVIILLLMMVILGWLFNSIEFYQAFGFEVIRPEVGLVLFSFLIAPFLYFLTPLTSILQRRYEYQADAFAREAIGASQMRLALIKIYRSNLGNLKPNPWYSFFHHSHPTLVERLKKLKD